MFSNDWFINFICSLVLSLSIFISLKYQRQTSGGFFRELTYDFMNGKLIYVLRRNVGVRIEKSIFQCVPTGLYVLRWIRHWLFTSYVGYQYGGKGPKVINQYFKVYALRRVSCAGYATEEYNDLRSLNIDKAIRCSAIARENILYVCVYLLIFVHTKKEQENQSPISVLAFPTSL